MKSLRLDESLRRTVPTKIVREIDEDSNHLMSLDGKELSFMDDEEYGKLKHVMEHGSSGKSGDAIAMNVVHMTYEFMSTDRFNHKLREDIKTHAMLMRTMDAIGNMKLRCEEIQRIVRNARMLTRTRMRKVNGFMTVNMDRRK